MPKPSNVPFGVVSADSPTPTHPPSKPKRKVFTAADKLRIVRAAEACTERGQVEALCRREGIYSSQLSLWRKALRLYGEQGLALRKRGRPKEHDDREEQIQKLVRENEKLRKDMERLRVVVELQKKASELLGLEFPEHVL